MMKCMLWRMSDVVVDTNTHQSIFDLGETKYAVVLDVALEGLAEGELPDIIYHPIRPQDDPTDFEGMFEKRFNLGTDVPLPHPSAATLIATAKKLVWVNGSALVAVELTAMHSLPLASLPAGTRTSSITFDPLFNSFHPSMRVTSLKQNYTDLEALASILSTMTAVFGIFRYFFPKSPTVP